MFVHFYSECSVSFPFSMDSQSHKCPSWEILTGILQQLSVCYCRKVHTGWWYLGRVPNKECINLERLFLLEFIDLSPKTQSKCTGYPVQISQAITESSLISSAPFLGPLHPISWACSLYLYQYSIDSRRIWFGPFYPLEFCGSWFDVEPSSFGFVNQLFQE